MNGHFYLEVVYNGSLRCHPHDEPIIDVLRLYIEVS